MPLNFSEVEKIFSKHLHMDNEPHFLPIVFGTVLANRLPNIPVWLMVIGAASVGKSEILGALDNCHEIHPIAELTAAGLVSGVELEITRGKKRKEPSLLPLLNGKIMVYRDASTLVSLPQSTCNMILSKLRAAYDGTYEKVSGSSGQKTFRSKFGVIIASTPAIEHHIAFESELGARFLNYRPSSPDEDAVWQRIKRGKQLEMKSELSDISVAYLEDVTIPNKVIYHDNIMRLASQIATLRTSVKRDSYTREVTAPIMKTEFSARVAKQLSGLYTAIHFLKGEAVAMNCIRRIARDSVPLLRLAIIRGVLEGQNDQTKLTERYGVSRANMSRAIEEMRFLDIISVDKGVSTKKGEAYPITLNESYKELFMVRV